MTASAPSAATVVLHFLLGYVMDEQQHRQAAALGAIERSTDDPTGTWSDERFARGLELIVSGAVARLGLSTQEGVLRR
jgi:TetR/AcrR family tetracycline transcriptional repressor